MDVHGGHLNRCKYGRLRIARHDDQVSLLSGDLALAAWHAALEPRPIGEQKDIRAAGAAGGTDYFDVTFVNPLAPSHRRMRIFNPVTSLNVAYAKKLRKYREFIAGLPGRDRLPPVTISTLGGWHSAAFSFVTQVARSIAKAVKNQFPKVRDAMPTQAS